MKNVFIVVVLSIAVVCCVTVSYAAESYEERNAGIYRITEDAIKNECFDNSDYLQVAASGYLTPEVLLAISNVEWGGYNDFSYAWSTPIPVRPLERAGINVSNLSIGNVDSFFLIANNITLDAKSSYAGSLQVNKSYFDTIDKSCNDYYRWDDQCKFYTRSIYDSLGKSSHNFTFPNEYNFVAHMSISANTGMSYWYSNELNLQSRTYPWKDETLAIFQYVNAITSEANILIIEDKAKEFLDKYNSSTDYESLSKLEIQLSRYGATELLSKMDLNFTNYLKPEFASDALNTAKQFPNEKVCHPIQVLYNYIILKELYEVSND